MNALVRMTEGPEIFPYHEQPKERVTSCNLCSSSVFVTVAHRDRYGFPLTVDACRACGLVFLNPRMTREAYAKFYDGPYRELASAYHGREINAQSIQPEQRRYAEALLRFLGPHVGEPKSLLDVGGSTGVVARTLARGLSLGDLWILDPAGAEIQHAAGNYAQRPAALIYTYFAEEFNPERTFSLITICQTIDHCLDIAAVLKMARKALTDDGLLFVDIVDLKAVLKRDGLSRAFKLDHPYYLTEETMEAYLRKESFDIVASNYSPDGTHVGFLCRPCTPKLSGVWVSIVPGALRAIREARQ